MEWCGLDWLAQDRDERRTLVNVVMNLGSIKCWESIERLHNLWPLV
jgi:hypothetical protein